MIRAFAVDKDEDLEEFGRILWQRKISHVIQTVGDVKVVAVAQSEQISETKTLFSQWRAGEVKAQEDDSADLSSYFSGSGLNAGLTGAFKKAPLTIIVIIACILISVMIFTFDFSALGNALMYPDFTNGSRTFYLERVIDNFTFIQFLKMFTPALLHGGYLHLLFNMMWTWEFGKCIESKQRVWVFAVVMLIIAIVSNTAQYIMIANIRFVGISGVVAGLMGYIAMWKFIDPKKGISLPTSLLVFMLVMIIAMAVIKQDFIAIANTAHISGLITGAVLGLVMASVSRFQREKSQD